MSINKFAGTRHSSKGNWKQIVELLVVTHNIPISINLDNTVRKIDYYGDNF